MRKGGGSAEAREARGTSKNDQNEGGELEKRGGLKRISAAIAAAADFQTMRRAGERSDRVSRGGLAENRDIEARERREDTWRGVKGSCRRESLISSNL